MFKTFVYQPLYNIFILLADWLPFFDAGMLVIVFTVVVKVILYPLSKKAFVSQIEMRKIQPKIDEIKKTHLNDKETQAKKIMEAYTNAKTNPFSGILTLFIQIPIIFGLYSILIKAGLPEINQGLLYSFVSNPGPINLTFFGGQLVAHGNILIAVLAGITTYIQVFLSSRNQPQMGNEMMAKMMKVQMRIMLPAIAVLISWQIGGVVGLYWTTSNIFTILQEYYLKKKFS